MLLLFIVKLTLVLPTVGTAQSKTDKQLINELRGQWVNYLQSKQLDRSVDLYADGAIFYSPDGNNAAGKAAIKKRYMQVMKQFTSRIILISDGVQLSGNVASDSGNYSETLTDNSTHKALNIKGSYLMALQKSNDGYWKINRMMWTVGK